MVWSVVRVWLDHGNQRILSLFVYHGSMEQIGSISRWFEKGDTSKESASIR